MKVPPKDLSTWNLEFILFVEIVTPSSIKKKKRIQTRDTKMKVLPKDLFTLHMKMRNGAKWEGIMNKKNNFFTPF